MALIPSKPCARTVKCGLLFCVFLGFVLYSYHVVLVCNMKYRWSYQLGLARQPPLNSNTSLQHVTLQGNRSQIDLEVVAVAIADVTSEEHSDLNGKQESLGYTYSESDRQTANVSKSTAEGKLKTILLWSNRLTDFQIQREANRFTNCPNQLCKLLPNRSQLAEADAVVFLVRDADPMPESRPPGQIWAYYTKEPQYSTRARRPKYTDKFNVTMTYRVDSDVVIRRRVVPRPEAAVDSTPYKFKYPLSSRNGSVAWAVGHCDTDSQREKYVESLAKYIDVDIYGKCGTHQCSRFGFSCFTELMSSRYKFYLAFENSICTDYITEKVYRIYQTEMIPVVYGGGNYTKLTREGTYINIMDYKSPKHLAEYLLALEKNETQFLDYFHWKK